MDKTLILAAYAAYAAFWIRFLMHGLVWWKATRRAAPEIHEVPGSWIKVWSLTVLDMALLGRVFMVNPALWLGEWLFHTSFLLVLIRHLRFFLDPVPDWVWAAQIPGLIAGYFLPLPLIYILVIRLLTKQELYASRANLSLLGLVLALSALGVAMHAWFKPDLVGVKLFILGILHFTPQPMPPGLLFAAHFILVLLLVLLLPTHIFTAPLVMMEARKREQALHLVIHDE